MAGEASVAAGERGIDEVSKLLSEGQFTQAEQRARQLMSRNPQDGVACKAMAMVLMTLGRFAEAAPILEKWAQLRPADPEAHASLGNALHELGRSAESEVHYRRALEYTPDSWLLHSNLGVMAQARGAYGDAEDLYRRALELKPDFDLALANLGGLLRGQGRLTEAEACCRRALEANRGSHLALINLGGVYQDLGRAVDAETCFRRALELMPEDSLAHNNLGAALQAQGRLAEAGACFRRAIELNSGSYIAYNNLATALHLGGRLVEAHSCAQRALEIKADFYQASSNLATLKGYLADFAEVKALSDASLKATASNAGDMRANWGRRLYILSYHPDLSAAEILAEFSRWGDQQVSTQRRAPYTNERSPGRRLRVGYVSPDFRLHTSRFYFEPLFANHDRRALELIAYSNVQNPDDHTKRFKTYFDCWRDISSTTDAAAAEMIENDRIDILVDGCNHMLGERLGVFARKPSPVQVTWLGSAWTSGLPTMDYALFDPYLAPDGTQAREAIVRLPGTFVVFRPSDSAGPLAEAPCMSSGHVTFGYFGRTERLNYRVLRLWGRILATLREARLILDFQPFADRATRSYFTDFMARHGLDTRRVTLRYSENVWAALNDIDIMLDSFPHNGGTMSLDSLWMGVPLLTLAERPTLGRIGATIMSNLGLGDWVATSEADYLRKAVEFGRHHGALNRLRLGMRERFAASPLRDEGRFAQSMERAYREMWRRWCAGQAPASFDVAA